MQNFEKKINTQIGEITKGALSDFTPGLCVQAFHRGRKKVDLRLGKTWKYYDLASMTKILFSASVLMNLVDRKQLKIVDLVSKHLRDWPHKTIQIKQLLTHSAGMPWWGPFYKKLHGPKDPVSRWAELRPHIMKTKRTGKRISVYSDLDLFVLGYLMTEISGLDLESLWNLQTDCVNMGDIHFNVSNQPLHRREQYAPTEKCSWRKKILQGEVHDENTWALGGVAPHAGLFGGIDSVSQWGLQLRQAMLTSKGSSLATHKTAKLFTTRAQPKQKGDWALGFMMPTRGKASAGKYFSSKSVGHTGFTGTSLWFDPAQDLLVVVLSNRVHPTRENAKYVGLRPLIHNIVYKTVIV